MYPRASYGNKEVRGLFSVLVVELVLQSFTNVTLFPINGNWYVDNCSNHYLVDGAEAQGAL